MNRPPFARRSFEAVLWHLLAGTRGGESRIRLLRLLSDRPYNLHQMAKALGVDYKTVMHHTEVLLRNDLVECGTEKKYGEMYFLTPLAKEQKELIEQIAAKLEKS